MIEKTEALRGAVAALRSELSALEAGDHAAKARVDALLDTLDQGGEGHEVSESLGDVIREFEVRHPAVTSAIERVLLALSSMGI